MLLKSLLFFPLCTLLALTKILTCIMNIQTPSRESFECGESGILFHFLFLDFFFPQLISVYFTLSDPATSEVLRGSDCLYI